MEISDTVCVLLGCSVPVVLRKIEDHYIFIGECYVENIMQGEVMWTLNNREIFSQVFCRYACSR